MRVLAMFVFSLSALRAAEPAAAPPADAKKTAIANTECMDCHEAEFKPRKKGEAPVWIGVRPELFAKSVHAKLSCVDCHATITETPHESKLPPAQCTSCHEKAAGQFAASIHGMSHKLGASDAATCTSCHGSHDMVAMGEVSVIPQAWRMRTPCFISRSMIARGGLEPPTTICLIGGSSTPFASQC